MTDFISIQYSIYQFYRSTKYSTTRKSETYGENKLAHFEGGIQSLGAREERVRVGDNVLVHDRHHFCNHITIITSVTAHV